MRRKGKPKAKTKSEVDHQGRKLKSAIDCDTDHSTGDGLRQTVAGGENGPLPPGGLQQSNGEAPLISVSIASAGPSSRSGSSRGPNSSDSSLADDESGSGQVSGVQRPSQDDRSSHGTYSSCVVIFDNESQTSRTSIRSAEDEQRPMVAATASGRHRLPNGIELVQRSYIRLMARNNLQYFHLGSLLYSLANMVVLLTLLVRTLDDGGDSPYGAGMPPLQMPAAAAIGCDSGRVSDPSVASSQWALWPLLAGLLVTTMVQEIVIILEFYIELKRPEATGEVRCLDARLPAGPQQSDILTRATSRLNPRHLKVLGIISSILIIVLPTGALWSLTAACNARLATTPIILLSLIVYILPDLDSELKSASWSTCTSRLVTVALYLALLLPWPLGLITLSYWESRSSPANKVQLDHFPGELSLIVVMVATALLAGLLRRRLRIRVHQRATFERANELIEAKVSLEQQRQQQETLLLSVLPAYVAEQVKRNMLKKMDSLMDGDQEAPGSSQQEATTVAPLAVATAVATPDGPPSQTIAHALLPGRSSTLPSNCDEPAQAPPVLGQCQQQDKQQVVVVSGQFQHRSLAKKLKLGSSFASNYLTTSKPGMVAQQQIQQQQQSDQAATSSQQALPSAQSSGIAPQAPIMPSNASGQQSRRGFNELYIRTYNNVSLLYGDIVGFTRLCTQLSSSQLVCVLNNLFSYFDYLAEQHKIMRIKILGDCYYGVSGIPEFAVLGAKSSPRHKQTGGMAGGSKPIASSPAKSGDNHAINCVNMGLDMIHYIKCLNIGSQQVAATNTASGSTGGLPANFELNMRIGIHTGHIHSGVIGLKKWQFDVWSNDVSIAMHCESSGVAGRVHVTEATIQHLRNAFTFEPVTRSSRDTFLADRSIRTYLIVDRVRSPIWSGATSAAAAVPPAPQMNNISAGSLNRKAASTCSNTGSASYSFAPSEIQEMDEERIREATIGTIRQTLLSGEPSGAGEASTARGLAKLDHNDMSWWSLEFNDAALNSQFHSRPISSVGYLRELCLMFLLLTVLLQAINYHYMTKHQDSSGASRLAGSTILLATSLVLTLALLLAGLPKKPSRPTKGGTGGGSLRKRRSLLDSKQPSSFTNSSVHWWRWSTSNSTVTPTGAADNQANNKNDADRHEEQVATNRRVEGSRFAGLQRVLGCWRASSCGHLEREASNLVSLCSILAAITVIISVQCYLVKREFCQQLGEFNEVEQQRFTRWRQLTVLVLLFAFDLSPSLLTYRLRVCLIAGLALIQIIVLCVSVDFAEPRAEDADESFFERMAARFTGWSCGGSSDSALITSSPVERDQRPEMTTISQSLMDWSGDALLLVLALWSLALNRQLEYSKRANFLWRNRLNVDHEELEYISGINKVLLENILPSHVVQHYLDQPASSSGGRGECQTASGPEARTVPTVRNDQPATDSSRDESQAAERRRASRVAASNHLMRVSMSSQLRNLHGPPDISSPNGQELYHEQHENVAVMFASIPHFYEFYDESDISKQGLGCIALLNEIICDFDKLLLKNKFSRIEKIKTIGSTYMAAAGLRPSSGGLVSGRNSTASQLSQQQQQNNQASDSSVATGPTNLGSDLQGDRRLVLSQQKMNLICMIQFATSLMSALNGINKQSFQVFKLRVGVNTGPVVAGIIGAQRPFYDIWGDCVNIASRMESLGEVGRIQVEERTAKLLSECLCPETYAIEKRGPIDVKGKGGMVTYFVDKRQQQQQQPPPPHQQQPQAQALHPQPQQLAAQHPQQDRPCLAQESPNRG